jgi:hypothetical protein
MFRSAAVAVTDINRPRLNGDTGANYDFMGNTVNGAVLTTNQSNGFASLSNGSILAASSNVDKYTSIFMHFMNANSPMHKLVHIIQAHNSAGGSQVTYDYINSWRNTSLITSISHTLTTGNWDTNSWYQVYGIKPS